MKNFKVILLAFIFISLSKTAFCQTAQLYLIKADANYELQNPFTEATLPSGEVHYNFSGLPILNPYNPVPPIYYTKVACAPSGGGTTITCGPFIEVIEPMGSTYYACKNSNSWECARKVGNVITINTDCAN